MRFVDTRSGNRIISAAAAIAAVLAALGTLFAHHRSILALSEKNQVILTQTRLTDTYNAYEAKQIRYSVYRALLAGDLVRNPANRARLEAIADGEQASMPADLAKATELENQSARDDEHSQAIFKSYETLQLATTLFEISIVLVSISALAGARILLPIGGGASAIGVALLVFGLFQGR
jgi:hypothetical protein